MLHEDTSEGCQLLCTFQLCIFIMENSQQVVAKCLEDIQDAFSDLHGGLTVTPFHFSFTQAF